MIETNVQFLKTQEWKILLSVIIGLSIIFAFRLLISTTTNSAQQSSSIKNAEEKVNWQLREGGFWVAQETPPPCPDPLQLVTPVDVSLQTAILYPGQVRGGAYKPHGGFRFPELDENRLTVTIPMDAEVIRGSRAYRNGENQYSFEFIAPCGIWYSFGHLLELTPKFQALADSLPLINDDAEGFHTTQIFSLTEPVPVTAGEIIATKVGYAISHNVFFDFGVLDLRQTNGFIIRSEWEEKYSDQFDHYGVCWLDLFSPADSAKIKALPGGDFETGKTSDYCN